MVLTNSPSSESVPTLYEANSSNNENENERHQALAKSTYTLVLCFLFSIFGAFCHCVCMGSISHL